MSWLCFAPLVCLLLLCAMPMCLKLFEWQNGASPQNRRFVFFTPTVLDARAVRGIAARLGRVLHGRSREARAQYGYHIRVQAAQVPDGRCGTETLLVISLPKRVSRSKMMNAMDEYSDVAPGRLVPSGKPSAAEVSNAQRIGCVFVSSFSHAC